MRLILLLAAAATAFAQTDTNTITVAASRTVTVAPDQVGYSVTVRTAGGASLNDAVAQLPGTGITAADLSYVADAGLLGQNPAVDWTFRLVVPFSKMKDTTTVLAGLVRQAGGMKGVASPISFSVQAAQTSADAQTRACDLSALVNDARQEAGRIASAAGVQVGQIVGISDRPAVAIPTAVERIGNFSAISIPDPIAGIPISGIGVLTGVFGLIAQAPIAPPATCSLVVQFRLTP